MLRLRRRFFFFKFNNFSFSAFYFFSNKEKIKCDQFGDRSDSITRRKCVICLLLHTCAGNEVRLVRATLDRHEARRWEARGRFKGVQFENKVAIFVRCLLCKHFAPTWSPCLMVGTCSAYMEFVYSATRWRYAFQMVFIPSVKRCSTSVERTNAWTNSNFICFPVKCYCPNYLVLTLNDRYNNKISQS